MNLLTETRTDIERSSHEIDDIVFIGSEESGHSCTWEQFECLADREYDKGYGAPEVAQDLVIVFSDGTKMWRGEYDGSEWWEFSAPFEKPDKLLPIKHLFVDESQVGWCDLAELNGHETNKET